MQRKNGISVLVATQNEEAVVGLCLRSFLEFADEIIVVDNGSSDATKDVCRELVAAHPRKIRFFDRPELIDLYQNRQFALTQSAYRWIVRADSDFVAYTSGTLDCRLFRERLLALATTNDTPHVYTVPQPNVTADFWHTGLDGNEQRDRESPGRYIPPPYTAAFMMRIYEYFPGFQFERLGRWEGVRHQETLRETAVALEAPLWMHCNLKSALNYLFRSERTNWRELGDFERYPRLETFLRERARLKYGTEDLVEAAERYMETSIYPYLQAYDPNQNGAYPELIKRQLERNCIYRIVRTGIRIHREYYGFR